MLKSCIANKVKQSCGAEAAKQQSIVTSKITRRQVADIICDPSMFTTNKFKIEIETVFKMFQHFPI